MIQGACRDMVEQMPRTDALVLLWLVSMTLCRLQTLRPMSDSTMVLSQTSPGIRS